MLKSLIAWNREKMDNSGQTWDHIQRDKPFKYHNTGDTGITCLSEE